MSGNRKMLRDQVRKHLKKAKKSVPPEYRGNITFSSVFKIMKSSAEQGQVRGISKEVTMFDDAQDFPTTAEAVQEVDNEDSDPEPTPNL